MLQNFKHYLFIVIWIIYFLFYITYNEEIYSIFWENITWKVLFSIFSSIIAIYTSFNIFSLLLQSTKKFTQKLWERKTSVIYPILSEMFLKFLYYANYIISIYLWFTLLIIPIDYISISNKIVSTIFIFITLIILSNIIITIFEKQWVFKLKFANKLSIHLSSIIKKILLVFLWIIGLISIISNLGYDVSALITWAWIWGLALALGAQKSLTNVFAAITIVLNKPFRIWDFIKIDWKIWIVKDIWISYLTITDFDWHQLMFPNEMVVSTFVENYTIRDNRKMELTMQLKYWISDKKLKKAKKIITEILETFKYKKEIDRFWVNFDNFGEYSLDIKAIYFSLKHWYFESLSQKDEINIEMKTAFKKAKIDIAFPTKTIIMEK